jgi:hypothetical protein
VSAPGPRRNAGRWIAIVASIVVVAAIAAAIAITGLPPQQRLERLDERRIADLGRIADAVVWYHDVNNRLPGDLAELAKYRGRSLSVVDPESGEAYGYERAGETAYRLCAHFATSSADDLDPPPAWAPDGWTHATGRQCFDRHVETKRQG